MDGKCCKSVYRGGYMGSSPCGNKGKEFFEGKWYCGVHSPRKKQARQAAFDREMAIHSLARKEEDAANKLLNQLYTGPFLQELHTAYCEARKAREDAQNG
jgi:hypothetical protein